MDKMKMHTQDMAEANIEKIGQLFPNCLTERIVGKDKDGKDIIDKAIDFDKLKQELSKEIVEGNQERYQFTWPGKREAMRLANTSTNMTLRPDRESSVDFDNTENIYIEGDNLESMKILREAYLGKIDVIYIDPPYNTGNDFVYEDDFSLAAEEFKDRSGMFDTDGNMLLQGYEVNAETNGRFHSDWLNMIYSRLKVAKDLVSSKGAIVLSIGYQEYDNLLKVCKELFGDRQVFGISVQTSGGKPNGSFNISNEYVVFILPFDFSPNSTDDDKKEYASPYHGMTLATFNQTERPNQVYPIYVNSEGVIVGVGKSLQNRIDDGEYNGLPRDFVYKENDDAPNGCYCVWPISSKGEQCIWRLIPARLLSDWSKGYIKVVPNKHDSLNNFTIQYLSGGVISQIENDELETFRYSSNPNIPTLDVKNYMTSGSTIPSMWDNKQFHSSKGSSELKDLFNRKYFSYPKPLDLITYIIEKVCPNDGLVLDMFSGSATTPHALFRLNKKDNGTRRFITIQIPEKTEKDTEAYKDGYYTICDIGKERIRRAGKLIIDENKSNGLFSQNEDSFTLDIGFRVLKLDTSNMQDVYYTPEDSSENTLFEDNVKPDRTSEDLLFQVMLECNLPLSAKIEKKTIAGKEVFNVNDGYLLACFDEDVNETVITEVAKQKPYYFIMRDKSLSSDNVADNFEQIFNAYSKDTIRKIL